MCKLSRKKPRKLTELDAAMTDAIIVGSERWHGNSVGAGTGGQCHGTGA